MYETTAQESLEHFRGRQVVSSYRKPKKFQHPWPIYAAAAMQWHLAGFFDAYELGERNHKLDRWEFR